MRIEEAWARVKDALAWDRQPGSFLPPTPDDETPEAAVIAFGHAVLEEVGHERDWHMVDGVMEHRCKICGLAARISALAEPAQQKGN